jgi:hypothetical protein
MISEVHDPLHARCPGAGWTVGTTVGVFVIVDFLYDPPAILCGPGPKELIEKEARAFLKSNILIAANAHSLGL